MSAVAGDEHHNTPLNGIEPVPKTPTDTPSTNVDLASKDLEVLFNKHDTLPPSEPVTTNESSDPIAPAAAEESDVKESPESTTEHSNHQVR